MNVFKDVACACQLLKLYFNLMSLRMKCWPYWMRMPGWLFSRMTECWLTDCCWGILSELTIPHPNLGQPATIQSFRTPMQNFSALCNLFCSLIWLYLSLELTPPPKISFWLFSYETCLYQMLRIEYTINSNFSTNPLVCVTVIFLHIALS